MKLAVQEEVTIDADILCVETGRTKTVGNPWNECSMEVSSGVLTEKLNIACLGCDRLGKANHYCMVVTINKS